MNIRKESQARISKSARSAGIARRAFLGGAAALGGGAALSPLLPRLVQAAPGGAARRIVVVSVGHSLDPLTGAGRDQWVPGMGSGGVGQLADFLAPLGSFKDRMVAVKGVDNLVARLVKSNGHNASSRTLLNCLPHKEGYSGGSFNVGSELDWSSTGGGASIEHVLASRMGEMPLVLRAGVSNVEHRRSFLADGSDDDGQADPRSAFENLFAAHVAPTETAPTAAEQLRARRVDIMDTVRRTYDRTAKRAGAADRARLQAHSSLIDGFMKELDYVPQVTCDEVPQLNVPADFPSDVTDGAGRSDHLIAPVHNSLIATAFGCEATRVASLHYSTMQKNQFPFLNGGDDMLAPHGVNWHGFCHHDAGTPDSVRVAAQKWYAEMLADLLDKLANTPDVDGSVLDNTIVVITSSLGDNSHSTNDIPFLLFGGANSGLNTNQVVDYSGKERTTADVWTTIMQLMGEPDESFGYDSGVDPKDGRAFNNGPLSEVMA